MKNKPFENLILEHRFTKLQCKTNFLMAGTDEEKFKFFDKLIDLEVVMSNCSVAVKCTYEYLESLKNVVVVEKIVEKKVDKSKAKVSKKNVKEDKKLLGKRLRKGIS